MIYSKSFSTERLAYSYLSAKWQVQIQLLLPHEQRKQPLRSNNWIELEHFCFLIPRTCDFLTSPFWRHKQEFVVSSIGYSVTQVLNNWYDSFSSSLGKYDFELYWCSTGLTRGLCRSVRLREGSSGAKTFRNYSKPPLFVFLSFFIYK